MMTTIRNRNRLLRLAGVLLLTAALALIPIAVFAADGSQAASASRTPLLPPTPVENLAGDLTRNNEVVLSWEDSADTLNPLCYGPTFFICLWASFFGYSAAEMDAPAEYAVERRQRYGNGNYGAWSEIGRASAAAYTDRPDGGRWGRTYQYRVKACNSQGCSAWSSNLSRWVRATDSAPRPDNSPF